jgi:hypothetical protein
LDLSPALWLDASDATTITESGGAVSQWNSKVGGHTFTQATGANQPTLITDAINGAPAISFDGSDNLLFSSAPSSMLSGATGATMFVVQEGTADPAASDLTSGPSFGDWGTDGLADHVPFTDGNVYTDFASTARKNTGNPALSLADPRVLAFSSQTGLWRFWVDGGSTVYSTTSTTFGLNTTAPSLGLTLGSRRFSGRLGSLLVFSVVLSTENIDRVGNFLADAWGTTWSAVS